MDPVAITNEFPIGPLDRSRVGNSPRPRKRNADHATIDQVGDDDIVGYFDVINPRFNADGSAHAMWEFLQQLGLGHAPNQIPEDVPNRDTSPTNAKLPRT